MSIIVRIDPTLCRGHAICALHLADEVEFDRWGFATVEVPVAGGRRAIRRVLRAEAACPNGAINIGILDAAGTAPLCERVDG